MNGSRPRKTNRHPMNSPTRPASAGPMTPGRTHAVESVANIRGRSRFGEAPTDGHVGDRRDRPGAESLDESREHEDPHRRRETADEQADGEEPQSERERPTEPAAVDRAADDRDPDQRPEEERREDPAVEDLVAQLVDDDRHHGRDRECLEGDQRDRQDQPAGQGPASGRPEAVVGGIEGGPSSHPR